MGLLAYNDSKEFLLAVRVEVAATPWARFVGLWGRKQLLEGEGLLLVPCRAVHTCFMQFEIDLVFLDRYGRVVHMVPRLRPFRCAIAGREAYHALELPVGMLEKSGTTVGDVVIFSSGGEL